MGRDIIILAGDSTPRRDVRSRGGHTRSSPPPSMPGICRARILFSFYSSQTWLVEKTSPSGCESLNLLALRGLIHTKICPWKYIDVSLFVSRLKPTWGKRYSTSVSLQKQLRHKHSGSKIIMGSISSWSWLTSDGGAGSILGLTWVGTCNPAIETPGWIRFCNSSLTKWMLCNKFLDVFSLS